MMEPSAARQMAQMISGYWLSQAIYVVARLGVADHLRHGPQTADALAQAGGAQPRPLYRLLRALASVGIFAEDGDHRFSLTPLAECLRSDVPGSQRAMALMTGEEQYTAYSQLLYSIQTGQPAFDQVHGKPVFDYLTDHPDKARVFDAAMVSVHGRETAAMLDVYDFSGIQVLADVGGGNGSVLTAILHKYPAMRGILFDLPATVERAKASLQQADLAGRCQVIGGSFLESVPRGADAYFMRHIIHDWDEERCIRILRNIHQVIPTGGKLLVVEDVIPPGNQPSFGKLLDLTMLAITGGQERTADEYDALFQAGGFRLTRIVPTSADVCVIEGAKA